MKLNKHESINRLVDKLLQRNRQWRVVDNWEADNYAVGICGKEDVRRLVYVSTYNRDEDHYDYECEAPSGPDPKDYEVLAHGENVDYETLFAAIETHLNA